ncbi:hypothetical protein BASA60_005068 [Batrachochytrium salamandrivorans]|nr:hypothetical protein BASA60_005068 [Batrachochytrium salamandrivorans]
METFYSSQIFANHRVLDINNNNRNITRFITTPLITPGVFSRHYHQMIHQSLGVIDRYHSHVRLFQQTAAQDDDDDDDVDDDEKGRTDPVMSAV